VVQRSEQELVRFEKLEKLRALGNPFPNSVKLNASTVEIAASAPVTDPGKVTAGSVPLMTTAGRIVALRFMGKAAFVNILDSVGRIQAYVRLDEIGAESFEKFKDLDIGDIIEVSGLPFVTKTGEKSLWAKSARLLTKCLIPLPEKWHGLTDIEARYRHRYVDLIANPEVRDTFRKRAQIIKEIRNFLDSRGFLEVETPVLQSVPGGADARPFNTHHNALGLDMHLRISLELPLKKLVVGGFDRVYELSRVFRNEGISTKHNPEFTMLEFYMAYATFEDLMNLSEELFTSLVRKICGGTKITFNGKEIDFAGPWPRLSMQESIHVIGGVSRDIDLSEIKNIHKVAETHKIHLPEKGDWGRCLMALWDELVEDRIVNPTFITHHPFSISPLARANDVDRKITDRFELIIAGMEASNAFSELNDAVDQRGRFESQANRKASGDQEAHDVDEDFLRALEYGLPPTAGQGIGIDRLTMLLTNSVSIRDVILFPTLKPEDHHLAEEKTEEAKESKV
jgi:lysyl-tRNA synthetase class 2